MTRRPLRALGDWPISSWAVTILTAFSLTGCEGNQPTAPVSADPSLHTGPAPHFDVYVHAHQDDWQLFMGDRVQASVQQGAKVIMIYTTNGDADRGEIYWRAREAGSLASMDTIVGPGAWNCGNVTVLTHSIYRCAKGPAVSYHMRMPTVKPWGESYGIGSLLLLQAGQPTPAADGSTTYANWNDFVSTLRQIITTETQGRGSPFVEVGGPDYNRIANPDDHYDHYATADALKAAAVGQAWDMAWYMGYHSETLPENLTTAAYNIKRGAFWKYHLAYEMATGWGGPFNEPAYQVWLKRTYVRSEPFVPPAPPTAPTALSVTGTGIFSVSLAWSDNAADETAYRIQRAPNVNGAPGTWADAGTVSANVTSYTNAGLAPGNLYWFRVRAESAAGGSAYVGNVSATTLPLPSPPAAPGNLQGTALSGSMLRLTWTDVAINETGYEIERAPNANGVPGTYAPLATLGANVSIFTDVGLTPNTRYWYRVRAINEGGTSAWAVVSPSTTGAFEVDVFVQAYQDDWQLHMGNRVNSSLSTAQKVVMIYTTAGDSNFGPAYWNTRETSSKASVDTLTGPGSWSCALTPVSGHSIQKCVKGKVVAYYMRMPDGFWGEGFGTNGSMQLLKQWGQPTRTIDVSTTYSSWNDFVTTLRLIIVTETGGQVAPFVEVNAPDYDRTVNPGDMPDRYTTGEAVLAASSGQQWDLAWYVGPSGQTRPVNVTGTDYDKKAEAFRAADLVLYRAGYGSAWWERQQFLGRTYYRTAQSQ